MATRKDADPLERWRHFEEQYAQCVGPFLAGDGAPDIGKDMMIELASLRAKADRWRDRFFKASEGVKD